MGWLYQRDPIDNPLAYLKAKYNYDCETHTLQTLDGARVRNTVYLAVRSTVKKTGGSFVFAAVIMISNTKKMGSATRTKPRAWGRTNSTVPCASSACCLRSPIFPMPALPPTGGRASPPITMSSASAGSAAHRSASAAS